MWQSLFGPKKPSQDGVKQIDAFQLAELLAEKDDVVLLDVRTPGEYEYDGHIEGSNLIPLSMLAYRSSELAADKTIVCICRSGNRSYTACQQLAAQGFSDVINLSGGMIGWKRARLPHK